MRPRRRAERFSDAEAEEELRDLVHVARRRHGDSLGERERRHPGKRGGRGAVLAALRRLPSEEGEQR